jgi:hypothetical protein
VDAVLHFTAKPGSIPHAIEKLTSAKGLRLWGNQVEGAQGADPAMRLGTATLTSRISSAATPDPFLVSCAAGGLARGLVGAGSEMREDRRTPAWRAMERAPRYCTDSSLKARHEQLCKSGYAQDAFVPSLPGPAWDDRFVADGDTRVKSEERTEGIEVHDAVLGQRHAMAWGHGGQLQVRAHNRLAVYE